MCEGSTVYWVLCVCQQLPVSVSTEDRDRPCAVSLTTGRLRRTTIIANRKHSQNPNLHFVFKIHHQPPTPEPRNPSIPPPHDAKSIHLASIPAARTIPPRAHARMIADSARRSAFSSLATTSLRLLLLRAPILRPSPAEPPGIAPETPNRHRDGAQSFLWAP